MAMEIQTIPLMELPQNNLNYNKIGWTSVFKSFYIPGGFNEELQKITYSAGAEYYQDSLCVSSGYFHEKPC
jgi:uncharacterized Zn-finger protein